MKVFENLVDNINAKFGTSGKESFDTEKMSNPNFIDFMTKVYKDVENLDPNLNAKELGKRYEIFQTEQKVVNGLDKIYAKHLTGLAEVDQATRQESIRDFIDAQLEENPDYLLQLSKKIEKFDQSEVSLNAQRSNLKRFEKHGGSAGIEEKLGVLKRAQNSKSWWKKPFVEKPGEAVEKMKKEYRIDLEDIDDEIEEVTDLLGNAKGSEQMMEQLQKHFKGIREEILSGLEVAQSLAEHGREALKNKSEDLVTNMKSKSLDDLKIHFDDMKKLKGSKSETHTVLEDEESSEEFSDMMEQYEKQLQEKLTSDVGDTISKTKLGSLENSLKVYLKTGEVGNLSQKEARSKVREEIEKASNNTSVPDDKRFLLKVLLRKYQHLA